MAGKSKRPAQKKGSGNGTRTRSQLLALAKDNPFRLFNVTEIRVLFEIPEHQLRRFRKLSSRDPSSDPWIFDLTRPEKFHDWIWGKRLELELLYREV